jgi:hypothetical protein
VEAATLWEPQRNRFGSYVRVFSEVIAISPGSRHFILSVNRPEFDKALQGIYPAVIIEVIFKHVNRFPGET